MSSLPAARHCIFAEQVRSEVGGKSTIIGFYGISPDVTMEFGAFPVRINLCAYLMCDFVIDTHIDKTEVEVFGPASQLLPRTEVPLLPVEKGKTVSCAFNFEGFPVLEAGVYNIKVFSAGVFHSEHSFRAQLRSKSG
jgi:hypothetical protein